MPLETDAPRLEQPRELLTKAGYEISEMYEAICAADGRLYSLSCPNLALS